MNAAEDRTSEQDIVKRLENAAFRLSYWRPDHELRTLKMDLAEAAEEIGRLRAMVKRAALVMTDPNEFRKALREVLNEEGTEVSLDNPEYRGAVVEVLRESRRVEKGVFPNR